MAKPSCETCGGACCEIFVMDSPGTDDNARWIALHATRLGDRLEFECRCSKLTRTGRCSIFDSPERPKVCEEYVAGGEDCLAVISRRRSPRQAKQILAG